MTVEDRAHILANLAERLCPNQDDVSVVLASEYFFTAIQIQRKHKMGYNMQQLKQLKNAALGAKLEGIEKANAYTFAQLQTIANGIGPEAFPEWLRSTIDALHPSLRPVAFVHDVEWHQNDGSEKLFKESNERFKKNGYKMASYRYAWFDPRRWIVRRQTRRFYRLLCLFGRPAFNAATIKKKGKKK